MTSEGKRFIKQEEDIPRDCSFQATGYFQSLCDSADPEERCARPAPLFSSAAAKIYTGALVLLKIIHHTYMLTD